MVYWKAVHQAVQNNTGLCIGKTAAIQIAKELNAAIKRTHTPPPTLTTLGKNHR